MLKARGFIRLTDKWGNSRYCPIEHRTWRTKHQMKYGEKIEGLEWISENLIVYQGYRTKLTPMVEQFIEAKKQTPNTILLFRMGDFYESFFEDAKTISRALDLLLTSRTKKDDGNDLPMAGVPVRSVNEYLFQLVEQGYRIAICEQLEDPATAVGLVKRGITQIITPGTLCDERPGFDKTARFLTSIVWVSSNTKKTKNASNSLACAIASIDLSTGYCTMTELSSENALQTELLRMNVREIITHHFSEDELPERLFCGIPVTYCNREDFTQQSIIDLWGDDSEDPNNLMIHKDKFLSFIQTIDDANFEHSSAVHDAFCGLCTYLRRLHYPLTANIEQIYPYHAESFMQIDAATFQNLEIYTTLRGGEKKGSLLGEIDDTVTGAGARLLRNWLAYPLKDVSQIQMRLDAVEELFNHYECRDNLRQRLAETSDLERITAKIANDKVTPKELVMLRQTLQIIPKIVERCRECQTAWFKHAEQRLLPLSPLCEELEKALIPEAPANLNDTGFFNDGYDEKLDHYKEVAQNGQQWLLNYEAEQKKLTGITTLKVKYQRIFGYFIEVTKSNLNLVPSTYVRSQTLANCERFYTPELKEYEEELLSCASRREERELELFIALKRLAATHLSSLLQNAKILAYLDVIASLAHTAHHRQYTRPIVDESDAFDLREARHPVVERFLPKGERFVPNDIKLDESGKLLIITGPNMAGKSTIIRQAAIITLMAQMGSFVPAESAHIGVVDRIFSRVGASDNLALGQSTFMVEMTETANILKNATRKSLVILDEIGRGTSTYDGLSLAWAIAEYLHTKIGARALFATHYHELTELPNLLPGVKNASIAVKEYKSDVIFLRKLIDGAANRSYGIQVAKLAGIPEEVLERAKNLLDKLEENGHKEFLSTQNSEKNTEEKHENKPFSMHPMQKSLFGDPEPTHAPVHPKLEEILGDICNLTLDATTPIQALNFLFKIQKKIKNL